MTQTAKQKPLIPAYLIVGEDALKRSTVQRRLRERLAQYGDLSFNSDTFDGETALGADIVSACNTMPFASEKRLVYVRDADKLKKADSEELVAYLDSPSDQTVLALEAEKLAKNTRRGEERCHRMHPTEEEGAAPHRPVDGRLARDDIHRRGCKCPRRARGREHGASRQRNR